MAGASPTQTRGGKRGLDGEINLVPFIDLLSMCICFLLMTAIWIEVGSIPLRQMIGTEALDSNHPVELQLRLLNENSYELTLEQQGRVVQSLNINGENFEQARSRLSAVVGQVQASLMNNSEPPEVSARIWPTARVSYGSMVQLLDILKGYGISALAVVAVKE